MPQRVALGFLRNWHIKQSVLHLLHHHHSRLEVSGSDVFVIIVYG